MSELGDEDQIGSYSIYFAEGETLAKQRQFLKAIESFSKVSVPFQCELASGEVNKLQGHHAAHVRLATKVFFA